MIIHYDGKSDLLYLRIEPETQDIINRRVTEDIVLDIGKDNKIVGIEILDASKHINLGRLMPVGYQKAVWFLPMYVRYFKQPFDLIISLKGFLLLPPVFLRV